MPSNPATLSFLFPAPSTTPPSPLSAVHWPGATAESTDALLEVLKHNHEKWHVFFNEKKFHNHAAHRALALYALGADGGLIKRMYEKDCGYEKEAYESPGDITEENFSDHLGDERYYAAYRHFFTIYIHHKGVSVTLQEFLFSRKYNLPSPTSTSSPMSKKQMKKKSKNAAALQDLASQSEYAFESGGRKEKEKDGAHMLSRFLSGLLHPFIHTGYGAEFGMPGMVVEGLAQTAVTEAQCTPLLSHSLFDFTPPHSGGDTDTESNNESPIRSAKRLADSLHKSLDAALLIDPTSTAKPPPVVSNDDGVSNGDIGNGESDPKKPETHALSILHYISTSPLVPPKDLTDEREIFDWVITHHGKTIADLVAGWSITSIEKAVEEVVWCVMLVYGVGGWTGRGKVEGEGEFNADFFLMHLVTSSLFLPPLLHHLPYSAGEALLRGYLGVAMALYIARGKPRLDINGFFSLPQPPQTAPNTWLPLLPTALQHNEEHVPKIIRALAHWGRVYGTRPRGFLKGVVEMEGAEEVDGTLFVRVAEGTIRRMGREGEGVFWDMCGFYE